MKIYEISEYSTEHVTTKVNTMISQVETVQRVQDTVHVETTSSKEISTDSCFPQASEVDSITQEQPTSVTMTSVNSSNTGENGAEREAADSSMNIEKDTSMQNVMSPKIPVAYLDDDVKTVAYSEEETLLDIDNEAQIPVDTGNDTVESSTEPSNSMDNDAQIRVDTGNDTVEITTNPSYSPDKTIKPAEVDLKHVVLKIQPLNDIEIDIWSNTVGHYYKFKAVAAPPKLRNSPTLPVDSDRVEKPISRRGRKDVDDTSMLTSNIDSEPEIDKKKTNKYRPHASGPSALTQLANKRSKHCKASKTDQNMILRHSYPIRYKRPIKATTETLDRPLPVETDLSVDTESS